MLPIFRFPSSPAEFLSKSGIVIAAVTVCYVLAKTRHSLRFPRADMLFGDLTVHQGNLLPELLCRKQQAAGAVYDNLFEPVGSCNGHRYNIIFAWEELSKLAKTNMDGARGRLLDILCNYRGMKSCHLIVVFDASRVAGHKTDFLFF